MYAEEDGTNENDDDDDDDGGVVTANDAVQAQFPRIRWQTTKGPLEIELHPHMAPNGVRRIMTMCRMGFFDDRRAAGEARYEGVAFFRVNRHITQFGATKHRPKGLKDDKAIDWDHHGDVNPFGGDGNDAASKAKRKAHPWEPGTIASIGGTQMVIVKSNRRGGMGINRHDAPAGRVVAGFDEVIMKLYAYNDVIDHPKGGPGATQGRLMAEGQKYIDREFPLTDRVTKCTVLQEGTEGGGSGQQQHPKIPRPPPKPILPPTPSRGAAGTAADVVELLVSRSLRIRVRLRPDLSRESARFARRLAAGGDTACRGACHFYRAEKRFLLQGTFPNRASDAVDIASVVKGPCPADVSQAHHQCGFVEGCPCHGPMMTKGMVGWAGGETGPHFFIYMGEGPAKHWGHDHTVWGEVEGDASFAAIEDVLARPTHKSGMTMLDEKVNFVMERG